MKEFLARASSAGKLMTAPRNKSEVLSETTKSYVKEWLIEQIYGFRKEIKSKYIDKGNKLEDTAIDKAIEWLDLDFVMKNEESFEDEYFTGTPDIITNDEILDTKCSWDAYSFPLFDTELPNKDYFYQMQVYMHLTGKKKARVVYVLLNTPEELTWEEKHDYSNMDKKYRIKDFVVEYDAEIIATLQEKVKEAILEGEIANDKDEARNFVIKEAKLLGLEI